ncbi:helix-turn-helix domain-containing protein [Apilactobacillus xinyiensis]|uniref:helix-turn-helix domain-containing protein n=1 Tax=Apilactobacillus xinyiensis TaxID=2841032 RepID=UPI00200F6AFE|nr:helix-turn-helix domain-containing protein [Apilactobacillus xinyiensis]MCL0330644.1 helix-turn-helix domain-containing protein [Apilactobacillus xinyiensis]
MAEITTPKKFIQMPIYDLKGLGLNSTDKVIYSEIFTMLNVMDKCFMSNARLAEGAEVSLKSASRSVNKLKKIGLINVKMVYKPNSKQIENRYITLSPNMRGGYPQKSGGVSSNMRRGIPKYVQDNRLFNILSNKEEEEEEASLEFYKSVWPEPNEILQSKLRNLVKVHSQILFDHAISVAASNGVTSKTSYVYLSKILADWKKNKVVDVKTADEYMKNRNKDKGSPKAKKSYKKKTVKESLPEWAEDGYKAPKQSIDKDKKAQLEKELRQIDGDNHE